MDVVSGYYLIYRQYGTTEELSFHDKNPVVNKHLLEDTLHYLLSLKSVKILESGQRVFYLAMEFGDNYELNL